LVLHPENAAPRFGGSLVNDASDSFRFADGLPREIWSHRTIGPTRKEEERMCANCGCGIPEDDHGDDRNINWSAIVASAEANDISPAEAVRNMQTMAEQQS
jgi:hypothetical protein